MRIRAVIVSSMACLVVSACSAKSGSVLPGPGGAANPSSATGSVVRAGQGQTQSHNHNNPIQHIVVIVQENRTFDNLFMGFPGADTQNFGFDHNGNIVFLTQVPLYEPYDLSHAPTAFFTEYDNGKLDGFDQEPSSSPNQDYAYQYTQESDVQPYWQLAQQYTLGDAMFATNHGPSFPAHQYLIAGQAGYDDNPTTPWGCDNKTFNIAPICYSYTTLADEMDKAHVSWRYYSSGGNNLNALSIWQPYQAIRQVRFGNDWTNGDIAKANQFFNDVSNGRLPSVVWISPTGANSDHPGGSADNGPAWVASLVNAIGQSRYWSSTAIIITWDDWGGWYDHVVPQQVDGNGYGFRVPLIVVSPYAQQGYVSHFRHEFGSILKFTEETFNLPSLGQVDARSDDLSDCFNFLGHSRPFTPIAHAQYNRTDTSPADSD